MNLDKPEHGAPCNQCGYCCKRELCPLAAAVLQTWEGPCPALTARPDGTYDCGFVKQPHKWVPIRAAIYGVARLRDAALLMIGAGVGCDACDDDEPPNEQYAKQLGATARKMRRDGLVHKAFVMWAQLPPPER